MSSPSVYIIAPCLDISGYGRWSRCYIDALLKIGLPIKLPRFMSNGSPWPCFDTQLPEDDPHWDRYAAVQGDPTADDICIAFLLPPIAAELLSSSKYKRKILFTLWETDLLPLSWIGPLCAMDEVWLPGSWNHSIFEAALAVSPFSSVPVLRTVGLPMAVPELDRLPPLDLRHPDSGISLTAEHMVFYTVSQWGPRKNIEDLVRAYWQAFKNDERVVLLLKVWGPDYSEGSFELIEQRLAALRLTIPVADVAPLGLIREPLSEEYTWSLHKACDCYVSTSRGEGLGLGMLEAGLVGNGVISSSFGEQSSYLDRDTSLTVNHELVSVPVFDLNSPYGPPQRWAQVDTTDLVATYRRAYEHRESLAERGSKLRDLLLARCQPQKVAERIRAILFG